MINNPSKIFSGYILWIVFLWIIPLYLYFGIYLSVSPQGIKKVCLGLSFWNSSYSFDCLTKVTTQQNFIYNPKNHSHIVLDFNDGNQITVNQRDAQIFKNNVIELKYANFLQVLKYYQKHIIIEKYEQFTVAEIMTSRKMTALFFMFLVVIISIGISVNNRLIQIYFDWGWSYYAVTSLLSALIIYKSKIIDERRLDNSVYSTIIGLSFGLLFCILLHLYVLFTVPPEKTLYQVAKIGSYHISWHDVDGKAPELSREGYYIAKADFDKYKNKQRSVDIYYGPFGLVMMDMEQSKEFDVE
ncbi:hypothetical protein C8N29_104111 [Agitococcus lubricus]|uniref:Uncharacterized protein n=2 Tax=Agitococcus lubricus TaxID=1077255 RepID=A0A2T5J105_9GAMM|nr:hypothetical protein C8N29_104111 [Agitococcus lubricus]